MDKLSLLKHIKNITLITLVATSVITSQAVETKQNNTNIKITVNKVEEQKPVKTINAKIYGNLKGDGSDETEKLRQLFKKLDKEYKNKHIEVYFPKGTYSATERINVYSNKTITGEKGKTIFKYIRKHDSHRSFFTNGENGKTYKGYTAGGNLIFKDLTFIDTLPISIGRGENIVIDGIHVIDQPNAHAIEISACNNVVIKNSIFEGLNRENTSKNMADRDYNEIIQIDSSKKESFPYFGEYENENYKIDNQNITIENNIFKPSKKHGITVAIGTHGSFGESKSSYKNIIIKDNIIKGATKAAITLPYVNDITIENNTIENTPIGLRYVNTSKIMDTEKLIIKNNEFTNVNEGILIGAYGTERRIKNVQIEGNAFNNKNKGHFAIRTEYTNKAIIKNNEFNNFKQPISSPHTDEMVIEDNKFKNSDYGVRYVLTSNSRNTKKILINNNNFNNINEGILAGAYKTNKRLENVNISNNIFNTQNKGQYGIKVEYTNNHNIKNNSFKNYKINEIIPQTKATVTASSLRLREKANTSSKVISSMKKGSNVIILERVNGEWSKVKYNNMIGYASTNFLN